MLTLPSSVRIYVAAEAVDLRRGFDGLAAATRSLIGEWPLSGHLLVPEPAQEPDQAVGVGPHRVSASVQACLLGDGVRVLTRHLRRLLGQCQGGASVVADHARAVKHRLLEISRAAKTSSEAGRERLKESYRKLLGVTGGVVRQVKQVLADVREGRLEMTGSITRAMIQLGCLDHYLPLVEKVIEQTRQRVFGGDRHVAGKVLGLFEPHTQVICKGKPHKPAESRRLVRLDEVEAGIVSQYQVLEGNPPDTTALLPAVLQNAALFGRVPRMATADRGYSSGRSRPRSWGWSGSRSRDADACRRLGPSARENAGSAVRYAGALGSRYELPP